MTRYQFLKSCGFTGGALLALLSCVKEEDKFVAAMSQNPDGSFNLPDGTPLDDGSSLLGPDEKFFISPEELENITPLFRIDLSSPIYARLLKRNGYMSVANTFVVALNKEGKYVAATVECSHERNRTVTFQFGEWFCPQHGARYNTNGNGLNEYGKNGLTVYKTAFDGQILVIYE